MLFFQGNNNDSLEKLVARVKNGDNRAFGKVYDQLVEKIYRFIFFKVSNRELAEDLTQIVFLKAFENIKTYREKTSFLAWIYTIARNQVIDYYRTKKQKVDFAEAEKVEFLDKNLNLEDKEEALKLYNAMQSLSIEEQEVIQLHSIDDYSFEEIAKITKKSAGGLRILKHRALIKLRKLLKND